MIVQEQLGVRPIESADDLSETRLEALGYIFHGHFPPAEGKRPAVRAGCNVLHFARCAKLEKASDAESKIWLRTIGIAKLHLDQVIGENRWKWCKVCERDITQKNINER